MMEGGALFHFSSLQAKRVSAHTGETLLPFSGFPRHIRTLYGALLHMIKSTS